MIQDIDNFRTPATDSTFGLSCTGTGGSVDESVVVDVTAAAEPPPVDPSPARSGGSLDALLLSVLASLLGLGVLSRMRLRLAPRAKLAAVIATLGAAIGSAQAADVTTVTLQNTSGTALSNAPVTFGQVFKPGDVANGVGITARTAGGTTIPVQVNAKARNRDGSLRHAVLTLNVPSLGANGADVVTLATGTAASGTAVALSSLLATSYDANVTLTVGGTAYTASARTALQSSPLTWLSGPQVSEWIAKMPVRTAGGANHPHLTAYFHVRAYAGNPITRVRTDVVIENGWTMVSGSARFTYDANLTTPGGQSYTRAGITHHGHTRWHKILWWGTQPTIYVKHDKNYLQDSRAIPKYENITPTDAFLNSARQSTNPMDNGDHSDNMEDTGFQEGIGPLPKWDSVYAISTDRRAFNYMLANADGGNAYSTHFRDENTGYPVTIDSYPNATLADTQASQPQIPEGGSSPFNVISSAHQPSIGFLPYIVTGDYFYLEEMQFWSSYNQIWTSLEQRNRSSGYFYDQSLRGQAWAYRSLAQSAYATPDDHALKSYFNTKLQNNITRFNQLYVSPGGPHKNNLGAMYMAEGNEQYRFYDYFMSWAVQYVVDLGFTEGIPFRDYKVKFPIGLMGMANNEYCFQAAAQYVWRVGPTGSSTFYPDFRTVFTNTAGSAAAAATCGSQGMTNALNLSRINEISGGQTEVGYYFANLQPALASAADSGVPGGLEAWQRSELSGLHPDYRNTPIWAIVPRGSVQGGSISVNLAANPQTVTPGSNATLTWTSSGAATCTASGGWAGAKAVSGSQSVGPLNTNTSFTLTCSNSGGQSAMSTAMVTVQAAPPAPTLALGANPTTVASGASSTLSWTSTNATSCTASGGWSGSKAVNSSQMVSNITAATTYTLTCTGTGGSIARSVTVQIAATPPAPTVTLTANPLTVASGSSSQLTWSSTNATSCTASGAWSGSKATSGNQSTGALTALSIYTLSCTGTGGTAQASATVDVTPPAGNSAVSGKVDSSFPDIQGDNRVYVFAGNVTPDDDDGDAGDPLQRVAVTPEGNTCTFSYKLANLAPGTYTLAFTRQGANDRLNAADSITFTGRTTVTVGASPLTQNFAPASILRVGPGRTYRTIAAAASAASDGAVIEVDAGNYPDDVVVWRQNRVTLRAIGGARAKVIGTRRIPFQSGSDRNNGKGLFVIRGSDIRIENMEFANAMVDDQNGAGIRNEGRNLTVCNSVFRDSENGFLGGAYGQLTIEYSTFARNGSGDVGRTHNLYVDEGSATGDRLVFRYNSTRHASIGHLLKTRARENWILYNRIMDENEGTSSYAIDAPNGGLTYVIGNLIQQGLNTDNSIVVAYGAEGLGSGRTNALYVINNTMVNDRGSGAFFDVASGTSTFRSVNNLFTGGGTLYSGKQPSASNNLNTSSPGLVDRAGFDYRLTAGSPAINAGTDPGLVGAVSLVPTYQYRHTARRDRRTTAGGTIDVGAYEYAP